MDKTIIYQQRPDRINQRSRLEVTRYLRMSTRQTCFSLVAPGSNFGRASINDIHGPFQDLFISSLLRLNIKCHSGVFTYPHGVYQKLQIMRFILSESAGLIFKTALVRKALIIRLRLILTHVGQDGIHSGVKMRSWDGKPYFS